MQKAGILLTAFNRPQVGAVDAASMGQFFLGYAAANPRRTNGSAKRHQSGFFRVGRSVWHKANLPGNITADPRVIFPICFIFANQIFFTCERALKPILLVLTITLAGCASNSGIIPIGTDTYMVSPQAATGFSGSGVLNAEAF